MAIFRGPNVVTDGLVLNLDAGNAKSYPGTGTSWVDLTGGGNNGTLVNGPAFSGVSFGSLFFDGTNDYATISTNFSIGNSCTMLFMINGNYSGYYLGVHSRRLSSGDPTQGGVGISQPIPRNGWIMVGYQGSTTGVNNFIMDDVIYPANSGGRFPYDYINDKPIFSMNQSGLFSGNDIQITTFNLQAQQGTITGYSWLDRNNKALGISTTSINNRYFNGLMSLIMIYNRVLSQTEIQQNYQAIKSRFSI